MVKVRLALAVLACLVISISLASPASALLVSDEVQGERVVAGTGCGHVVELVARMPPKTRSGRILFPAIGEPIFNAGRVVARVSAAAIVPDASGFFARFTASGSDDVCANPFAYPAGWSGYLGYTVKIRRSVQAYAQTTCSRMTRRARPRTITVDCSRSRNLTLRRLRWSSWAGRTAAGRGVAVMPECRRCGAARKRAYSVKVELSHPKPCGRIWQYERMSISFIRARPTGIARGRRYSSRLGLCPS